MEYKLANHAAGQKLKPSVKLLSNTIINNQRSVILERSLNALLKPLSITFSLLKLRLYFSSTSIFETLKVLANTIFVENSVKLKVKNTKKIYKQLDILFLRKNMIFLYAIN